MENALAQANRNLNRITAVETHQTKSEKEKWEEKKQRRKKRKSDSVNRTNADEALLLGIVRLQRTPEQMCCRNANGHRADDESGLRSSVCALSTRQIQATRVLVVKHVEHESAFIHWKFYLLFIETCAASLWRYSTPADWSTDTVCGGEAECKQRWPNRWVIFLPLCGGFNCDASSIDRRKGRSFTGYFSIRCELSMERQCLKMIRRGKIRTGRKKLTSQPTQLPISFIGQSVVGWHRAREKHHIHGFYSVRH